MTDHKDARQLLADITADGKTVFEQFAALASLRGALAVHMVHTPVENVRAITDLVAAQAQRIAELEAERQWQPIETAPRDGTIILGKGGIYHGVPFPVKWAPSQHRPDYPWECVVSRSNFYDHCLSHWMPLPASPHEGSQ